MTPVLTSDWSSGSVILVENGGGILRNVSSYIAAADSGEAHRAVLRAENCLALLLDHLRSNIFQLSKIKIV